MFEVDGTHCRVYCENLCFLSKLFLDHKTLRSVSCARLPAFSAAVFLSLLVYASLFSMYPRFPLFTVMIRALLNCALLSPFLFVLVSFSRWLRPGEALDRQTPAFFFGVSFLCFYCTNPRLLARIVFCSSILAVIFVCLCLRYFHACSSCMSASVVVYLVV